MREITGENAFHHQLDWRLPCERSQLAAGVATGEPYNPRRQKVNNRVGLAVSITTHATLAHAGLYHRTAGGRVLAPKLPSSPKAADRSKETRGVSADESTRSWPRMPLPIELSFGKLLVRERIDGRTPIEHGLRELYDSGCWHTGIDRLMRRPSTTAGRARTARAARSNDDARRGVATVHARIERGQGGKEEGTLLRAACSARLTW